MLKRFGAETVANFQRHTVRPALHLLLHHKPDFRYSQTAWLKQSSWFSDFSIHYEYNQPVRNEIRLSEKGYDSPWWAHFRLDQKGLTRVNAYEYHDSTSYSTIIKHSILRAIVYSSLLFTVCLMLTSTAFSQGNTVSGNLESTPYNLNSPSKIILKNKSNGKIYSDSVEAGQYLIKHVPNGNYTLEVLAKDNHQLLDTLVAITGNLNKNIQVVQYIDDQSSYYDNVLQFFKNITLTTGQFGNTFLYKSFWLEGPQSIRTDLNKETMPTSPLNYEAIIDSLHQSITDSTNGLVSFRFTPDDSLDTWGNYWIFTPNPPNGTGGWTEIRGPPGDFLYDGAWIYIKNNLTSFYDIVRVTLRELARSFGFRSLSIDPNDVTTQNLSPTAQTFSYKEKQSMKILAKLSAGTNMFFHKEDSVITFTPTNYKPQPFTLIAPNGNVNPSHPIEFNWNRSIDQDNNNLEYFLRINGQEWMTLDSNLTIPANTFPINQNYNWQVIVMDGTDSASSNTGSFNTNNQPPIITTPLGSIQMPRDNNKQFAKKLSEHFADPESDTIIYTADGMQAVVSGDSLYIFPTTKGTSKVGVTATSLGGSITDSLEVLVTNNVPIRIAQIPNAIFPDGSKNVQLANLTEIFYDKDNDTLTYQVTAHSDLGITLNGAVLTANTLEGFTGTHQVIIRASDPEASASDTFNITLTEVDRTPPVLNLEALAINAMNYVRLKIGANEALSAATLTVNGQIVSLARNGDQFWADCSLRNLDTLTIHGDGYDLAGNADPDGIDKTYYVSFFEKPTYAGDLIIKPTTNSYVLTALADSAQAPSNWTLLEPAYDIISGDGSDVAVSYRIANSSSPDKQKIGIYVWDGETWEFEVGYKGGNKIQGEIHANRFAVFYNPSGELPKTLELLQNYPNPFNPGTTIEYSLDGDGFVDLRVYNLLGQEVRRLVSSERPAGWHHAEWNGKNNEGMNVSSGIYLYRLQTGNQSISKRMLLVK